MLHSVQVQFAGFLEIPASPFPVWTALFFPCEKTGPIYLSFGKAETTGKILFLLLFMYKWTGQDNPQHLPVRKGYQAIRLRKSMNFL